MSPAEAPPRTCHRHPERPVHARCMSCGRTLCRECATEWDGINHCAACLGERRRQAGRSARPIVALLLLAGVIAGLLFLHTRLLVWVGVLAARSL